MPKQLINFEGVPVADEEDENKKKKTKTLNLDEIGDKSLGDLTPEELAALNEKFSVSFKDFNIPEIKNLFGKDIKNIAEILRGARIGGLAESISRLNPSSMMGESITDSLMKPSKPTGFDFKPVRPDTTILDNIRETNEKKEKTQKEKEEQARLGILIDKITTLENNLYFQYHTLYGQDIPDDTRRSMRNLSVFAATASLFGYIDWPLHNLMLFGVDLGQVGVKETCLILTAGLIYFFCTTAIRYHRDYFTAKKTKERVEKELGNMKNLLSNFPEGDYSFKKFLESLASIKRSGMRMIWLRRFDLLIGAIFSSSAAYFIFELYQSINATVPVLAP